MPETHGAIDGRRAVRAAIVAHARREAPRECCGLLLGDRGRILFALPMANVAADPIVRFRVDDRAHLEARRLVRRFVPPLGIVGVYHSHPKGEPQPSETDLAEAHYPEWVYLIAGVRGGRVAVRGFRIARRRALEVRIRWRGMEGAGSRVVL